MAGLDRGLDLAIHAKFEGMEFVALDGRLEWSSKGGDDNQGIPNDFGTL